VTSARAGTYTDEVSVMASQEDRAIVLSGSPVTLTFTEQDNPVDSDNGASYDQMKAAMAALGPEAFQNNIDLMLFRKWINDHPELAGSGFVDATVDVKTRHMNLEWKGTDDEDLINQITAEGEARSIDVEVRPVVANAAEIAAAMEALMDQTFATPQGLWKVASVSAPTLDNPQITVSGYYTQQTGETPTPASWQSLQEAASIIAAESAPGVPVVITDAAPPVPAVSRSTDWAPFNAGGMMLGKTGAGCSSGFAVTYDGQPHITTARHCDDSPFTAWGNPANVYGSIIDVSNPGMALVLSGSGSPLMFDGTWDSADRIKTVTGWADVSNGNYVCQSGANSGVRCDLFVYNESFMWDDERSKESTVAIKQLDNNLAGARGDSGGPVFIPTSPTQVLALGMFQWALLPAPTDCSSIRIPEAGCSPSIGYTQMRSILAGLPEGSTLVTRG